MLLDAKLPYGGQNYRTLRFPWIAIPAERPRLAARSTASGTLLYATWNGATGVHSWQVLAGSRPTSLTPAIAGRRTGFETRLHLAPGHRYAAVTALDAVGKPLGRSAAVPL